MNKFDKHLASVEKSLAVSIQKNADRKAAAILKGKESFVSADFLTFDGIQLLKNGFALYVNRSTSRQMEKVEDGNKYRETRYSCAIAFADSFEAARKVAAVDIVGKVTIIVVDGKIVSASGAKLALSSIADALKAGTRFCPSYKVNK